MEGLPNTAKHSSGNQYGMQDLRYCSCNYEGCSLPGQKTQFVTHRTHYISVAEPSRLMLCKLWGFHGGNYEERPLLGFKKPLQTSQETLNLSAIEPSQLMLCKISGFHGGDYEECRLLGFKKPLHNSQETLNLPAIEPSRLMRCKIWDFTAATMKNAVFWDKNPRSYPNGNTLLLRYRDQPVHGM
jgi:hypothetical protein